MKRVDNIRTIGTGAALRRAGIPLLLIALLGAPPTVAAQQVAALRTGVMVRVERRTGEPPTVRGSFVTLDSLSVVLAAFDDPTRLTSIPRTHIRRLELSESRRTAGQAFRRGAGRGLLVGVGLSAGLMAIGVIADKRSDDSYVSGAALAAVGGVLATAVTTLTGGLIGLGGRERWQRVRLETVPGQQGR